MTKRRALPFVVIPEFRVRLQVRTAFLDAALDDARHSLANEAGCHRVDVVCPEGAEVTVLFYEVFERSRRVRGASTNPASEALPGGDEGARGRGNGRALRRAQESLSHTRCDDHQQQDRLHRN